MKNVDNQIFTIGHGNRSAGDFLNLIQKYNIEVVIDVRTFPYSRFYPQFRKGQLEAYLNGAGIKYLFLGNELGGRPQNPELYIDGKVNYTAIKQTELFKSGIRNVLKLIKGGIKVTLMCSESDQNQCHRKHLITDELIQEGLDVIHINKISILETESYNYKTSLFD